ncbi:hypothetical protein D3C87_2090120 [compost metagenome]
MVRPDGVVSVSLPTLLISGSASAIELGDRLPALSNWNCDTPLSSRPTPERVISATVPLPR